MMGMRMRNERILMKKPELIFQDVSSALAPWAEERSMTCSVAGNDAGRGRCI